MIKPAKSKLNKWENTEVKDSSIYGIPSFLISIYGLEVFFKLGDNK